MFYFCKKVLRVAQMVAKTKGESLPGVKTGDLSVFRKKNRNASSNYGGKNNDKD